MYLFFGGYGALSTVPALRASAMISRHVFWHSYVEFILLPLKYVSSNQGGNAEVKK